MQNGNLRKADFSQSLSRGRVAPIGLFVRRRLMACFSRKDFCKAAASQSRTRKTSTRRQPILPPTRSELPSGARRGRCTIWT